MQRCCYKTCNTKLLKVCCSFHKQIALSLFFSVYHSVFFKFSLEYVNVLISTEQSVFDYKLANLLGVSPKLAVKRLRFYLCLTGFYDT